MKNLFTPHYWMYSNVLVFSTLSLAWSVTDLVFSVVLSRTALIGVSSAVAVISLISLITTIIFTIFNRRPESKHRLTRVSTHYYSLAIIALLLFIIGIPLLALIPGQCSRTDKTSKGKVTDGMLCGWLSATIAYTWSCALFAGMAVFIIQRRLNRVMGRVDMSGNIASLIRVGHST